MILTPNSTPWPLDFNNTSGDQYAVPPAPNTIPAPGWMKTMPVSQHAPCVHDVKQPPPPPPRHDTPTHFPGFVQSNPQFRPPTPQPIQPVFHPLQQSPYLRTPEQPLTASQVESMIDQRMRQYQVPMPPPSMTTQQQYAPVEHTLPIDEQIIDDDPEPAVPATFSEWMAMARAFDKHPGLGGWHPRPPPTPLDPAKQCGKSWAEQRRDENTYRSRVRRANIPQEKQKDDAWQRLVRKTHESAQVITMFIFSCFQCSMEPFRCYSDF